MTRERRKKDDHGKKKRGSLRKEEKKMIRAQENEDGEGKPRKENDHR